MEDMGSQRERSRNIYIIGQLKETKREILGVSGLEGERLEDIGLERERLGNLVQRVITGQGF